MDYSLNEPNWCDREYPMKEAVFLNSVSPQTCALGEKIDLKTQSS
jgi:hypothetical protein